MNNNYLFLKMQTGGQLSPEQLQRAQQMGQLPQMGMGAGLNDIQKMNMQQAEHYGMFRRGGVPRNYAEGGEQEEIDQQYLSPYVKYNQRVSEFLENLKSTAMGALQDEMMGVNDEYAQEADQIEMEQAQYGQQVSQPTVNPQGMNAVNAWMGAAQNTKDMVQPLAQTAGLASGLKGYWGSQDDYEANPYNSAWNPTRLTVTDNTTGKKTVTRAKRNSIFSQPIPTATQPPANTNEEECTPGTNCFPDTYEYGGQYFDNGGQNDEEDFWSPEEEAYIKTLPRNQQLAILKQGDAGKAQVQAAMQGQAQVASLPTSTKKKTPAPAPASAPAASATSGTTTASGTTATTTNAAPTGTEVVKNADGTESSISPEEVIRRKAAAAAQATQVVDPGKTPAATPGTTPTATTTTTPPKTGTGEIDYLASLADPTGQNAGGVYRTDRNGNPVPMAFYDPNMRLTGMKADYRNNAASWFRKNKKPGQMKSVSFDFGSSTPYTVPGEPATNTNLPPEGTQVVTNPDGTESSISPQEAARREQIAMGIPEGTSTITNPDGTQSSVAPDFYERNFPAPKVPTWDPSQFIPKYNAPSPPAIAPQAPQQPAAPQPMSPGAAWNPQDFLPTSLRTAQQAPLNAQQQAQLAKLNQGAKGATAGSSYSPAALSSNPAGTIVQGNDGNFYFQDANGQTHSSNNQNSLTQKRDGLGLTGKRKGGQYFGPGGENEEGVGVLSNPVAPPVNTNFFETGLLPQAEQSNYMSPVLPGETVMEQNKSFTAKYDKNKKSNPFFAPAMLAGLNTIAGATQNADAKKKEGQLRGKFSYDQIYSANPETSGNRGDWTFNEGYMRPNDMVPTQFTGNGMQTAQWGGAYAEGDELYLDEDAIQAFLAAGGQLDYLD